MKKILQIGDPILESDSKKVDPKDPRTNALINELLTICYEKESVTAGLSAPQIGENVNICICRRTDLEELSDEPISKDKLWEVLINPIITKEGKKHSIFWEGCLSIGEGPEGLFAPVSRPGIIEVEYEDINGNKRSLTCKGFFSHLVQHEMDHLRGILFIRYVQDPTTIWKGKDLDKYYEKNGDYPPV